MRLSLELLSSFLSDGQVSFDCTASDVIFALHVMSCYWNLTVFLKIDVFSYFNNWYRNVWRHGILTHGKKAITGQEIPRSNRKYRIVISFFKISYDAHTWTKVNSSPCIFNEHFAKIKLGYDLQFNSWLLSVHSSIPAHNFGKLYFEDLFLCKIWRGIRKSMVEFSYDTGSERFVCLHFFRQFSHFRAEMFPHL